MLVGKRVGMKVLYKVVKMAAKLVWSQVERKVVKTVDELVKKSVN